ncbi:hypothetical protein [Limnohabitans planktonicus]|uniref:hypothetical protein n=1 Tax=Limnohabitans planktonicus TaxID=540060 RepID=UPI0010580EFE|nr:hypothetical protein [Limnohabitans planktonicus]
MSTLIPTPTAASSDAAGQTVEVVEKVKKDIAKPPGTTNMCGSFTVACPESGDLLIKVQGPGSSSIKFQYP